MNSGEQGINRIISLCCETGLKTPKIAEVNDFFDVELLRSLEETLEKVSEKSLIHETSTNIDKILGLMIANPRITTKELEELTALSRRGIEWNIDKLKEQGRVKRLDS